MLLSEKSELLDKIKQEKNRADEQYAIALRIAIGVINRDKYLSNEDKERLIKEIYK